MKKLDTIILPTISDDSGDDTEVEDGHWFYNDEEFINE